MIRVPETLPARMFLLAYDTNKQKMTKGGAQLGYVLRAAALTELYLDGRLGEGRRGPVPGTPGDDPYGVLAQIAASPRPRTWKHWVRKDSRAIVRTVRDELVHDGWIRVRRRTVLGVFPRHEITVKDPRVVKTLWGGASSALRGRPVAHVNSFDAAAVALAAAGELKTVLPGADRRRYRRRIAELTARTGPAAPAVRRALDQDRSDGGG
ncbi:Golgi phosphoprotein 3 GPP34 [Actinomadura pelletieri DSM 43383]|uniref:Golgi phosphoprotein 3 GPP34 n=1 Tax=Actinomadura pelletieri DSM 43383 TaxID=1120940 RepID=A0A495QBJ8_9ACTN|nr:GPP34 family phosphoprotein [Actinomadura pelletieri]RKS69063.1 Golgi phosphoprotein 3 GPP34 [Actinomadura pelletieri DSM 43383]